MAQAGVILVVIVVFVGETNVAVLLRRKTERLGKETENEKLVPKFGRDETPKQMLFTTFTSVFSGTNAFSIGISELVYLGLGIAMMLGLVTFSMTSDKHMKMKE